MINLAGVDNADINIKEELHIAGIQTQYSKSQGEVPFTYIGKVGNWTFKRAWYYWIASCEHNNQGLPLSVAMKLHETLHPTKKIIGNTVRSGGHCGCPSPDKYGAQPDYNEELDSRLMKLGYKKVYSEILNREYIPITVGEVSTLCNEGKLDVERYVDCYHIDDQIGLNEFVRVVKEIEIKKIRNET